MFTLTFASQIHMPSKSQKWKKQFRANLIGHFYSSRTIQTHCSLHVLSSTTEFSFSYLQLFRGCKLSQGSLAGTHISFCFKRINRSWHDWSRDLQIQYILQKRQSHLFRLSWKCLKVLLAQVPLPNQTGVPGSQESPKLLALLSALTELSVASLIRFWNTNIAWYWLTLVELRALLRLKMTI